MRARPPISLDRGPRIFAAHRREDGYFQLREVAIHFRAELTQLRQFGLEIVRLDRDRGPSVANPRGVAECTLATGADVHWRMRPLRRLGITAERRKLHKFSLKARFVPRPQFLHRSDILAGHRPASPKIDAHDLALVAKPTRADSEQHSPTRVIVEGRDLFGQVEVITLRHQTNSRTELDAIGRAG